MNCPDLSVCSDNLILADNEGKKGMAVYAGLLQKQFGSRIRADSVPLQHSKESSSRLKILNTLSILEQVLYEAL